MRMARLGGIVFVVAGLVACSDDGTPDATAGTRTPASSPAPTDPPGTAAPVTDGAGSGPSTDTPAYYLAIGDSYAVGFLAGTGPSTEGFADGVVAGAALAGQPLVLVNVGCSGATTASLVGTAGCAAGAQAPEAATYGGTQLDAAIDFLEAHPGEVALITVSIGGNDVIPCAIASGDLVACVTAATATAVDNLASALTRIRAAAPDALIVGTTYPDVALGAWTTAFPGAQERAVASVAAFRDVINPALRDAYATVGARFVDVTEATGGYDSMDETTTLAPYGDLPTPVAKVCELTAFCSSFDIHPTPAGYDLIADLVLAEYLR